MSSLMESYVVNDMRILNSGLSAKVKDRRLRDMLTLSRSDENPERTQVQLRLT